MLDYIPINEIVLIGAATGILSVFLLHPLVLVALFYIRGHHRDKRGGACQPAQAEWPTVTIITTIRDNPELVSRKIENALALHYPADALELLVVSDGPDRGIEALVLSYDSPHIRFLSTDRLQGKNAALRLGAAYATHDVFVFSDADAMLAPDAVQELVRSLADPAVGGVCGQRVISETASDFQVGQEAYLKFDNTLRVLEGCVDSLTTNDGKIHAVRREVFAPPPDGVGDDLFQCIAVVRHGYRFVYASRAKAYIRRPSRSPDHELVRRRRIVCRNLVGISMQRDILNPHTFGLYAVRVAIDKIFRRLLPVFLIAFLISSVVLGGTGHPLWSALLIGQIAAYALACVGWAHVRFGLPTFRSGRIALVAHYFVVGNVGNALGLLDFFRGVRYISWLPRKNGQKSMEEIPANS